MVKVFKDSFSKDTSIWWHWTINPSRNYFGQGNNILHIDKPAKEPAKERRLPAGFNSQQSNRLLLFCDFCLAGLHADTVSGSFINYVRGHGQGSFVISYVPYKLFLILLLKLVWRRGLKSARMVLRNQWTSPLMTHP